MIIPDPLRLALLAWAEGIMTSWPPIEIFGQPQPFMKRWLVTGRRGAQDCEPFEIFIHKITGDDPMELHDHPWASVSVMLSGEVVEEFAPEMTDPCDRSKHEFRVITQGEVVIRPAEFAHRLMPAGEGAITLFMVGPWTRDFGRFFADGWRSSNYERSICP